MKFLRRQKRIHCAHNDRKDQNADKFDYHCVNILRLCGAVDVSVTHRGQRGDHPVQTRDIDKRAIVFLSGDVETRIVKPGPPFLMLAHQNPPTCDHMHNCEENDKLAEDTLNVALGLL